MAGIDGSGDLRGRGQDLLMVRYPNDYEHVWADGCQAHAFGQLGHERPHREAEVGPVWSRLPGSTCVICEPGRHAEEPHAEEEQRFAGFWPAGSPIVGPS